MTSPSFGKKWRYGAYSVQGERPRSRDAHSKNCQASKLIGTYKRVLLSSWARKMIGRDIKDANVLTVEMLRLELAKIEAQVDRYAMTLEQYERTVQSPAKEQHQQ